ncbi:HvfC family RiPP maturation protein [Halomonas denitrificans]|nr:putative DNA-binding domain-containing protein [Halomonas denitrificans]
MPTPPERLAALQKRFADHIRDPDTNPAPEGIEDRRLAIYRRLFFNNVSSLFEKNFPLVRKTVGAQRWKALIRAFLVEHRATTPLFPEIGREFVRFLADHPEHHSDRPWLAELAHWQFLTTTVRNDERDPADVEVVSDGDPVEGRPRLNPTLQLAAYRWPVHAIRAPSPSADESPYLEESPTALAICRTVDDRLVRLKINPVTGRLLELLKSDASLTGRDALQRIAGELDHPDPAALVEHGRALLEDLCRQGLICGTAHEPPD